MDFKEIVMERYATKKFDGRKVHEDKIKELLEMIRFAASGINIQPWKIKVITDQKVKDALRPVANNQEQVSTCSHLIVLCAENDIEAWIGRVDRMMKMAGMPDEARTMLVGMTRSLFGPMTAEQRLAWAKCQVYLALGNAVNGAKSLGLDSCPMTGFDPAGCARILELPSRYVPTAFCPVGYAADVKPPVKVRLPLEEILL
jgi:nitroreductase